jgi:hypothetical protein
MEGGPELVFTIAACPSEPGLSPAARGAERHIQPVMGGTAGMDPARHAAHGPTGTVPT